MRRRHFLQAATAVPLLTGQLQAVSDDRRSPVVDTHLHCFAGKDDDRFPYALTGRISPPHPPPPSTC